LLAIEKVEALDLQSGPGPAVGLTRARSWPEMYGSAEWKIFVAARKELDAIDRREKK
jgi:hypothetical protein